MGVALPARLARTLDRLMSWLYTNTLVFSYTCAFRLLHLLIKCFNIKHFSLVLQYFVTQKTQTHLLYQGIIIMPGLPARLAFFNARFHKFGIF